MKTYILGYDSPEAETLTLYRSRESAAFNSEEWVEIEAESLDQAISMYEDAFSAWQNRLLLKASEPSAKLEALNKPLEGYYAKDVNGVLWPFTWTIDNRFIVQDKEVNPDDYVVVHIMQLTADNYDTAIQH